jgi:hypothetical protein
MATGWPVSATKDKLKREKDRGKTHGEKAKKKILPNRSMTGY